MSLDINLLCLAVGAVVLAVAALLRWLTMTLTGDDPGSLWDWFWGILDILSSL
ncbi:MAG: hypothetical protein HOP03_08420 [Lysobacter sp.]|nr:hypothetical protein [Lysobacter sp.]